MSGWALAESGVKEVNVYIDRNYVSSLAVGGNRPDVAKAFPAIPNGTASAWATQLNTKIYTPGSHEIIVQAVGNNGATRDIADVFVGINHP